MIENNAMFKLSYGLYVLTARQEGKDNGCIVNTVIQITDSPKRVLVAVNKDNFFDSDFGTGINGILDNRLVMKG